MPVVRLNYPRGALSQAQKRVLAGALTDIVLDAEVDAVTEAGKMVTVIQFNEVAADDWAVAGQLRSASVEQPNHFIVDVIVLEGLLEGGRRSDIHRRVAEAFQKAFGEDGGASLLAMRVWILIHEVREGGWGAAGRTVSALDVAQFIGAGIDAGRLEEITVAVRAAARR